MRLIDADALKEKMKCTNRYFNIKFDIDEAPTIDPEMLPVVQELRKQLAQVTVERNELKKNVRPVVRGLPILKYRPQRYERYEEMDLNEKGEMLYLKRVYLDEKNYAMYCSDCGKRLCSRFTSFCPSCGADMRGEVR